ncbi:MFS transporter [Isachenkonia alkalipeptolytica]|uniref:MFS transporter n=1 Tax=Isachenkonia alkalipeptolytica TaxID=2565777 RepID=A0AA43XNK3_9CLOT|nr:MFS transporter [Isachenkonia alkalipeptolytica]NBG89469.1 MFS transporter [Isachenkonia alkalipeptolytica]
MNESMIKEATLKNWVLFYTASLLVFINFWAAVTTTPLYILELGGRDFHSGLQGTLFFLGAVVFRIYLGPLSDRRGRKIPLLIGAFVFGSTPLLLYFAQSVWAVIFIRIYQSIGLAAYFASGPAFVGDVAPFPRMGTYMGLYRLMSASGLLIGPFVAVYMINHFNYSTWFLGSFAMGIMGFLFLLLVQGPPPKASKKVGFFRETKEVLKDSTLREIYLGIAIFSFASGIIFTFAPVYLDQIGTLENPGIFFTIYSFAGIIASVVVGKLLDHKSPLLIILFLGFSYGTGLILLTAVGFLSQFMILAGILMGTGYAGAILGLSTRLIKTVSEESRAIAISIQENTIDVFIASGSFVFSGMLPLWGYEVSFGFIGTLIIAAMVLRLIKERKRLD